MVAGTMKDIPVEMIMAVNCLALLVIAACIIALEFVKRGKR